MEERVGLREVNHRAGQVFRRVTADNEVVVTESGKPRWRIVPYVEPEDPMERLVRVGRLTAPANRGARLPRGVRTRTGRTSTEILEDLRGDR